MCSAGSYAELMAEPALAGARLVAATLPRHAGAPPPDDYGIENYARLAVELAGRVGADVVVGFSLGASVALEMVTSGGFDGPLVLLGIMARGAALMVKRIPVSAKRQEELRADLRKNVPQQCRAVG
jgi:hypothetical protein